MILFDGAAPADLWGVRPRKRDNLLCLPPLTCCSMWSDQQQGRQSALLLRQDGPPPDSCSQFCCCLRSGAPKSPEDFITHLPPSDKHSTGEGCYQGPLRTHLCSSKAIAYFLPTYCLPSGVFGTAGMLSVISAQSASCSCKVP